MQEKWQTRSTSNFVRRKEFMLSVRHLLNEQVVKEDQTRNDSKSSDSSASTSSVKIPKDLSREQQAQYFNRKMSAKQDQELKDYVRDFRKKVENIY